MLDLKQLTPQVDAMAIHIAMNKARLGQIPWTPELARENNRDMLARLKSDLLLSATPNFAEEVKCAVFECSELCLLTDVTPQWGVHVLIHQCLKCGAKWAITIDAYSRPLPKWRFGIDVWRIHE